MRWADRAVLKAASVVVAHVPNHVAFIMDGNRRFAKAQGERAVRGHSHGYSSLLKVLEWCLALGVTETTIYAFSIENFKRPKEEVDTLMRLAQEKFVEFLDHKQLVMQHGIRVRVLGDLTLLPEGVRKAAANVMLETATHTALTLNICFSYSSGEEISRTIRDVVAAARRGELERQDIDKAFLNRCMYTRGSCPDLLIRTSGETRLSDFLAWQANEAHLSFVAQTWPEFDIWHFVSCVWEYSWYHAKNAKAVGVAAAAAAAAAAAVNATSRSAESEQTREYRQDRYCAWLNKRELEQCERWR